MSSGSAPHYKKLGQVVNPTECLQQIISAYYSYKVVVEQEQTKRREIEAWEKTTLEQIRERCKQMMTFLNCSFDQRAETFSHLFDLADQAIASGNNEQLANILGSITEISKSNPFNQLADLATVQAALDDPDHKWEF